MQGRARWGPRVHTIFEGALKSAAFGSSKRVKIRTWHVSLPEPLSRGDAPLARRPHKQAVAAMNEFSTMWVAVIITCCLVALGVSTLDVLAITIGVTFTAPRLTWTCRAAAQRLQTQVAAAESGASVHGASARAGYAHREPGPRRSPPRRGLRISSLTSCLRRSGSIGLRTKPSTPAAKASRRILSSFFAVTTKNGIDCSAGSARIFLHKSMPLTVGIARSEMITSGSSCCAIS